MATTLVKGLVAVGALGTASGVGTLVYLNTGTTISNKLTDKGFKLIDNDEDYKFPLFDTKNHEKLKKVLELKSIVHTQHVSNLKKWCDDNLNKWASSDKDNVIFDNAKVWCVVPKIKTLGQKVNGTFHDSGEWKGKYDTFVKDSNKTNFINALKAQFDIEFEERTTNGGEKLKEWCEKAKNTNIYDVDTHKNEDNVKKWCVKSEG